MPHGPRKPFRDDCIAGVDVESAAGIRAADKRKRDINYDPTDIEGFKGSSTALGSFVAYCATFAVILQCV